MCNLQNNYILEIEISLILMENIKEGVFIIHAINDFSDEYMVPIDSESFKTPSLTPHTLPNSKLNIYFVFFENSDSKFEI